MVVSAAPGVGMDGGVWGKGEVAHLAQVAGENAGAEAAEIVIPGGTPSQGLRRVALEASDRQKSSQAQGSWGNGRQPILDGSRTLSVTSFLVGPFNLANNSQRGSVIVISGTVR